MNIPINNTIINPKTPQFDSINIEILKEYNGKDVESLSKSTVLMSRGNNTNQLHGLKSNEYYVQHFIDHDLLMDHQLNAVMLSLLERTNHIDHDLLMDHQLNAVMLSLLERTNHNFY